MSDLGTNPEAHNPRRRNKDVVKAAKVAAKGGDVEPAEPGGELDPWEVPNPKWGPEVTGIFMAMKKDVMNQFMTPVAWAQLYLKCEAWDKEFKSKFLGIAANGTVKYGKAPVPPAVLADITKTLDSFGGSEQARRNMKILIDPSPEGVQASQAGDARMSARKAIARPVRRQVEE